MDEEQMISLAIRHGYEEPFKKVDFETLKCHDPISEDTIYLRFVEEEIHYYQYKGTLSR